MNQIAVIHVIGALPVGGVERNLVRILPRLNRERYNLQVVCIRERGDLAPEMEAAGIPVSLLYQKSRYHPVSLWRLRNHFKEKQAAIVHCHMRRANTSGRIAAMLAGTPVRIATERDMGLGKNRRHYLIDRILGRFTDLILTVTRGVAEHEQRHSGLAREKFRVLYNGLDLERFRQLPAKREAQESFSLSPEKPVVGVIGRLHEIKNVDAVIRAMAEPGLSEVQLLVIGDGRERERLEALAGECSINDRVVFAGFQDDLPRIYAAIDVQVLASSSEGIANVQMESMAARVPLVSTPVGLACEACTAGQDYIEIEKPEPSLIAAAVAQALQPEVAAALQACGTKAIQAFSIENQVASLEAIYEELLATKTQG